mmetsp:Transcript_3313/g.8180  ORF Transcript_3313/g.8180 Transcript_3313/m.8180 type:complete len:210 (-) Transcript_3313:386-1015(-)
MASMHSSGCWRCGARFRVCSRATAKTICATSAGSRRSVRSSVRTRCTLPLARSRARRFASARRSSGLSHTASAIPSAWAFLALTGLLVRIISKPACKPTRRGSRWVPPKPGIMPSWSSGRPMRASGLSTRALHAMATSHPPPRAMPRTAATVGFAPSSKTSVRMLLAPLMESPTSPVPLANSPMSKPAQKFLPLPTITMPRTSSRPCAS